MGQNLKKLGNFAVLFWIQYNTIQYNMIFEIFWLMQYDFLDDWWRKVVKKIEKVANVVDFLWIQYNTIQYNTI